MSVSSTFDVSTSDVFDALNADVFRRRTESPTSLAADFGWPGGVRACELSYATWDAGPDDDARLPLSLRRAVRSRQRDFLAGRRCGREALASAGVFVDDIPVGDDKLPVWPAGWRGSISHSRHGAVAVVASSVLYEFMGIDIQSWISETDAAAIAAQIGSAGEWEILSGYSPIVATTLLFSAKESLFKALYPSVRRILEFDAAHVVGVLPDGVRMTLSRDWNERWRGGKTFDIQILAGANQVYSGLCLAYDGLRR